MKQLFSLSFSLATITGLFLDRGIPFEKMSLIAFIVFLAASIALAVIMLRVIEFLLRRIPFAAERILLMDRAFSSPTKSKRHWLIITLALMLCWLPAWLAFRPGLWNYDVYVVHQVLEGDYINHNPLLNTLFLGISYAFGKMIANENAGVVLYTILQATLMAAIFSYAICYVGQYLNRLWMKLLLFCFYAVFPLNVIMVMSPTKDVLFAGFITLLTVWMLQLHFDEQKNDNPKKCALRVGLSVLTLLTRHNGLAGIVLLTVCALFARKRIPLSWKRKKMLLLTLVLWFVFSNALKTGLNAKSLPDGEIFSVSFQQFGRIYTYGTPEEQALSEEYFDFHISRYIPSISDTMKWGFDDQHSGAFLLQSVKWAFDHPLLTLDAWLYLTKGQWDIDDRTHTEQYRARDSENKQGYLATHINDGYDIYRESVLPELEKWYTDLFAENRIFNIPVLRSFFSPAFWHWLFLFCVIALLTYAPKTVSAYLLFPGGILLSLLFGPCALIRYSYPFVTSAPILLVFVFVFAIIRSDDPVLFQKEAPPS